MTEIPLFTGRQPGQSTVTSLRAAEQTNRRLYPRRGKWILQSSWNEMAHGDARERKWRGNWRMQWVASTLHTTSEHGVSSITAADAHTSAASSRLNWRPANLNGLVRFAERRNLVSKRVPSHLKLSLPLTDRADRLYDRRNFLFNKYPKFLPGIKATGGWSWPFTAF